jgi:hypothetical protein
MAFLLPVGSLAQVAQQDSNQGQRILREVRQILANEHAFDGMSISSSVHHGIITPDGTVSSQAAKVLGIRPNRVGWIVGSRRKAR